MPRHVRVFRNVLGAQLLTCSDYNCERAIRTMELLKLRFGEPVMHACEVRGLCIRHQCAALYPNPPGTTHPSSKPDTVHVPSLSPCAGSPSSQIMLKDMAESRRTNVNVLAAAAATSAAAVAAEGASSLVPLQRADSNPDDAMADNLLLPPSCDDHEDVSEVMVDPATPSQSLAR